MEFTGGFAPDASEFDTSVLHTCTETIPAERGMIAAPLAQTFGAAVLASACRGAFAGATTAGVWRHFAGTQTHLYQRSGTTWTNRTTGSYTGSSTSRWMFAQFGDITLATDDVADIQAITTGNFAAIAGAPKARIVITVPNFAIAFNTQNGATSAAFGDSPDRWWCSAYQDPTDWAISAATQCVSERLIGSGGEITAAAPFGTGWVAYKNRDMFHAYYTGDASVFTTQRVPGNWGCVGPEAVADIGNAHFVVGEDDIFIYDGARPVSVASGKLRNWFFGGVLYPQYSHLVTVRFNRSTGHVWVFYPDSSGELQNAIVYHLASGRWGAASHASLTYPVPISQTVQAVNVLPNSFDGTSTDVLCVFVNGGPMTLNGSRDAGPSVQSVLATGRFGDNGADTFLSRAHVMRTTRSGGSEFAIVSVADVPLQRSGYQATSAQVAGALRADGTADFRSTAAWHSLRWTLNNDFEVSGCEAFIQPAGGRAS